MQRLKTFTINKATLRVAILDETPVFSLKDLITILDLKSTMKDIKLNLHNGMLFMVTVDENKNETFVSEQALYKLYAMSEKEDIARIVDWMSKVVIPTMKIYDGLHIDDLIEEPLKIIKVLQELEKKNIEISLLKNKIEIQEMHERVYQNMYGTRETVPLSSLARYLKIDGMNQLRLLEVLRAKKVLQPNDMPYQEFIDKNYFQVVEHTKAQNGEREVRYTVIVFKTGINFIRKLLIRMAGEKNE